ncbi:hypothetical protein AURDEDRAFT_174776 [Auricularia subglabra TFB-10046 SS5]|uniref:Uncharacterized protein n=1 Tax=Auricularia subglabra (strain TFB-10046 / SS5) TaxID=717982 RepID=J0LFN7_AURST|nr:hypothetical protein AURDEDRAFT_174776 [Auricularia subglabra TFB-10046 SS5]
MSEIVDFGELQIEPAAGALEEPVGPIEAAGGAAAKPVAEVRQFDEAERDRVLANIEEHQDQLARFEALRLEWGRSYANNPDCPPGYEEYCNRNAAEEIAAKITRSVAEKRAYREPAVDVEMRDDKPMPVGNGNNAGTPASVISSYRAPSVYSDRRDTPAKHQYYAPKHVEQQYRSAEDESTIRLSGDLVRDGFKTIFQIAAGKSGRGKPYERKHGHGSREDQAKEVKAQIKAYLDGGEYPRFKGWQWKMLSPEDNLKLAQEQCKRDREQKVREIEAHVRRTIFPNRRRCFSPEDFYAEQYYKDTELKE